MSALSGVKWFVADLLPDAIQLAKLAWEARRERKLDRKEREEAIKLAFVAAQKARRAK